MGLSSHINYGIIKAFELELGDGSKTKLIRIRNLKANGLKWKGDWSDKDTKWNSISSDVKTRIAFDSLGNDDFFMPFSAFLAYFQRVEICHNKHCLGKEFVFSGNWKKGSTAGGCGIDGLGKEVDIGSVMFPDLYT